MIIPNGGNISVVFRAIIQIASLSMCVALGRASASPLAGP